MRTNPSSGLVLLVSAVCLLVKNHKASERDIMALESAGLFGRGSGEEERGTWHITGKPWGIFVLLEDVWLAGAGFYKNRLSIMCLNS